jgi:hypothetical protein
MEAPREPCYLSIPDVSFGLVKYMNKVLKGGHTIYPTTMADFENSRRGIVEPLTKNDRRSEREMSSEK